MKPKDQALQLILLDGATGVGKTTLLKFLQKQYRKRVFVGTKLTTRQRRADDNEWEFIFVENVPERFKRYSFDSVGNSYAINSDEINQIINQGLIYTVSCVDKGTLKRLKANYSAIVIYIYRSWNKEDLDSILESRDNSSSERRDEITSITDEYLEKIQLYDHVLLNIGSEEELEKQLSEILALYNLF
ncbi:MAG: hypothetical protein AAGJ93_17395 [Bacteroidota bacterium]